MVEKSDRPRFIERRDPGETPTPDGRKRQRANVMLLIGVLLLILGTVGLIGGSPVALVAAVLGVGLLVGGLVLRP